MNEIIFIGKDETVSTNNDLKEIIKSGMPGSNILEITKCQTGGRGRQGRSFLSPSGGIYFSFTVIISGKEKNPAFLTSLAGLCVLRRLEKETGENFYRIKWPNDIYVNGKKLCGILTELVSGTEKTVAVVGIGINNKVTDMPDELKDKITFIEEEARSAVTDEKEFALSVCKDVLREVYENENLINPKKEILDELKRYSYSIGRSVLYGGRKGLVTDITPGGALKVLFSEGEEIISTGEVVHI